MQRRKFIVAIVNTIAAAPMFGLRLVSAQQTEKVRRVGVLMGLSKSGGPTFFFDLYRFVTHALLYSRVNTTD